MLNLFLSIHYLSVQQILPWKLPYLFLINITLFIPDCQLEPEIEISDITNTPSCLQKGTPKKTVGMSGEIPSLGT